MESSWRLNNIRYGLNCTEQAVPPRFQRLCTRKLGDGQLMQSFRGLPPVAPYLGPYTPPGTEEIVIGFDYRPPGSPATFPYGIPVEPDVHG